jgi:cellulose synthase/poly-beta-1,6-N-acetylglucosamine synthase-like glycosyltransferase
MEGALLLIVIFTVAVLDVLLSLSLTVYVKVSAVALPLGVYVIVPSSLIVILPLTGADSICIVLGLIVPSGSVSLSKTLMVTGFP